MYDIQLRNNLKLKRKVVNLQKILVIKYFSLNISMSYTNIYIIKPKYHIYKLKAYLSVNNIIFICHHERDAHNQTIKLV